MTFNKESLSILQDQFNEVHNIVIVAHKSPDGDSVGSSLALLQYLTQKGFNVSVCHPDPLPYFLNWLPRVDEIINYIEHPDEVKQNIERAHLIFCLDFNSLHRLGADMSTLVKDSSAFTVMIDHHLDPSNEFDLIFSETSSCSTAQLIYDFIVANGDFSLIDPPLGEAIYCGIMTDSGSFRFPSTTAHTHEVIAQLLHQGVDHAKIHESIYDTNSLSRLKLRGYATNEKLDILDEYSTAIISLTDEELFAYNYQPGDAEGIVNVGLSIIGINKSIFLKESNGVIKISFRSKGSNNPINTLAAKYFGGGGHANAAGGVWEGSMNEAIERLKNALPEFCA